MQSYYERNKEKIKKQQKEWYKKNRFKTIERTKEYYRKNKETVLPKMKKLNKVFKKRRKEQIKEYIDSRKTMCENCKENNIVCLSFHHLNKADKKYNISKIDRHICNVEKIQQELDKCIVLCHNCHRKEHSTNYQSTKKKDRYVRTIKLTSKCSQCDEYHYATLDFHHIDPTTKIKDISYMKNNKEFTLDDIKAEILKCVILCANCHAKHHSSAAA
jgi:hypothetical protein